MASSFLSLFRCSESDSSTTAYIFANIIRLHFLFLPPNAITYVHCGLPYRALTSITVWAAKHDGEQEWDVMCCPAEKQMRGPLPMSLWPEPGLPSGTRPVMQCRRASWISVNGHFRINKYGEWILKDQMHFNDSVAHDLQLSDYDLKLWPIMSLRCGD